MPELPEVENNIRRLKKELINKKIQEINLSRQDLFTQCELPLTKLIKSKITKITRRGKYIIFHLTLLNQKTTYFICHLRMSGKLYLATAPERKKYICLSFKFCHFNKKLYMEDVRKFAKCQVTTSIKELMNSLGPEPLSAKYNANFLFTALNKKTMPIKAFLLDQKLVAGIGNIYGDEILFLSKIHPLTPCAYLPKNKINSLVKNTKYVLKQAIKAGGTDFGDKVVSNGFYSPLIYGKLNEKCVKCNKRSIERLKIRGRSSYFCKYCQVYYNEINE